MSASLHNFDFCGNVFPNKYWLLIANHLTCELENFHLGNFQFLNLFALGC